MKKKRDLFLSILEFLAFASILFLLSMYGLMLHILIQKGII
jgi:hypothetical protein